MKLAEEMGFDFIWYASDFRYADSFSALAYAATKTKTVKLASMCNSPYVRHPVYIASGTSTIDEVSGGRAVLGLASAGYEVTVKLGVEAKEPLKACREAIQVIKSLWRGEPVNHSGEHYYLKDVKLPYKVRENIPIYLATRGAKFKLAGELCDGTITHGKTTKYIERIVKHVREGAEKAERKLDEIDITTVVPFMITNKVEEAKKSLRPLMAGYGGSSYTLEWVDSLGFTAEEVKPLRKAVRERQFAKTVALVSDELLEKLVNAYCVVGNVKACINHLEEMEKAGLTQIIPMINHRVPQPEKEMRMLLETLGTEVIPSFKD
jgi:5,10-methylenetetrahydromethanopterin reductase